MRLYAYMSWSRYAARARKAATQRKGRREEIGAERGEETGNADNRRNRATRDCKMANLEIFKQV